MHKDRQDQMWVFPKKKVMIESLHGFHVLIGLSNHYYTTQLWYSASEPQQPLFSCLVLYLYSLSVGGLLLEWFHMKRGLIFTLWWPSTYILYDLIILLLLLCTNIVYVTYFVSSNWPNGTTNQVLYRLVEKIIHKQYCGREFNTSTHLIQFLYNNVLNRSR